MKRLTMILMFGIPVLGACNQASSVSLPAPKGVVTSPAVFTKPPDLVIGAIPFMEVPSGQFLMGPSPDEPGREPDETQRVVSIVSHYWISKFEITQEQFEQTIGVNPSLTRGSRLPVTSVTVAEAEAFCERASTTEYRLRLPTEIEWEYAARAGSASAFSCPAGESAELQRAVDKFGQGDLDFLVRFVSRQAWFNAPQPREAGTLQSNAWGLHDMVGNVWEMCAADLTQRNPIPIRGGAWSSPNVFCCRAAQRDQHERDVRKDSVGFRVVAERRR